MSDAQSTELTPEQLRTCPRCHKPINPESGEACSADVKCIFAQRDHYWACTQRLQKIAASLTSEQRERAEAAERKVEELEESYGRALRLADVNLRPARRKNHAQRTELNRLNRTLAAERKAIMGYQLRLASLLGITTPSLGPTASPTWEALLLATDELEQIATGKRDGSQAALVVALRNNEALSAQLASERAGREHLKKGSRLLQIIEYAHIRDPELREKCWEWLRELRNGPTPAPPSEAQGGKGETATCSFCLVTWNVGADGEAGPLVKGYSNAHICAGCVALAAEIIAEHRSQPTPTGEAKDSSPSPGALAAAADSGAEKPRETADARYDADNSPGGGAGDSPVATAAEGERCVCGHQRADHSPRRGLCRFNSCGGCESFKSPEPPPASPPASDADGEGEGQSLAESLGLYSPKRGECVCWACLAGKNVAFMVLCPTCGNKRCPKANDHRNECSGSNEPGQPGSAYADQKPPTINFTERNHYPAPPDGPPRITSIQTTARVVEPASDADDWHVHDNLTMGDRETCGPCNRAKPASPPLPVELGPVDALRAIKLHLDTATEQANASERADSEVYHRHFITLSVENVVRAVRLVADELAGKLPPPPKAEP